jgi:hypothetical protein
MKSAVQDAERCVVIAGDGYNLAVRQGWRTHPGEQSVFGDPWRHNEP